MAASGVPQLFELPGNILKNYNYAKWHHSYTVTESRSFHQGKHVSVKLFHATQEKLMFSSDSVSPLTHRTVSQIISVIIYYLSLVGEGQRTNIWGVTLYFQHQILKNNTALCLPHAHIHAHTLCLMPTYSYTSTHTQTPSTGLQHPSTAAVFSYTIGSRKLSANRQFFCWCSNSSKFVTNNSNEVCIQIQPPTKFTPAQIKTTVVWNEMELFSFF